MRTSRYAFVCCSAAATAVTAGGAQDQDMATPEQHPDEHAVMAAEHAMAGMVTHEDLAVMRREPITTRVA